MNMADQSSEALLAYRDHLVLARQSAQASYDKALFALSGGALGLSLTFVDRLVGEDGPVWPGLLLGAWTCWTISLLLVVASHLFSRKALTAEILAIDEDRETKVPGGCHAVLTEVCNLTAGATFVIGVVGMITFVYVNLLR